MPFLSRTPWQKPKKMETGNQDEAPKDPGALTSHPSYTDKDFEGHRAHTVYVGLHVPGYHRRGHRRHHRHHHKNGHAAKKDGTGAAGDGNHRSVTPPAERVHFILGEEEDGLHEAHPLFSEMEILCAEGEEMEWREAARWIKFEEDVEEGGDRWSKPHVSTISLHALMELRSFILNSTVMLDMEATSLENIADLVLENMVNGGQLSAGEQLERVKEVLLRRHRHQHERHRTDKGSRLPLIRSLADIGRNSSKSMFGTHNHGEKGSSPSLNPDPTSVAISAAPCGQGNGRNDWWWMPKFLRDQLCALPGGSGNNTEGMTQSPSSNSLHIHAPHPALAHSGSTLTDTAANASSPDLQHRLNQAFMKKIPPGSQASNILVGEVDFLERPVAAFVRLAAAVPLGDLTEVPVPTRFLFILLGPQGNMVRYHEVGRAIAILMSDEVFHDVAFKAKNRDHLLAGVDEFLDAATVLPPGAWDPSIRIEPPQHVPSQEGRKKQEPSKEPLFSPEEEEEKEREQSGLKRSGKLFGGLINDIKRKAPWYWSDFKDAFALQSIASVFFLYFACLTPIITFGGLLGSATEQRIAAMESLMSGAVCGILYGLFSGQPLTILGSTGPVLVFETILYDFCKDHDLDYLSLRLWIGLWTALILLVLVAFDASALVCYITRFTEENFATLISLIFIYKAIENVLKIGHKYPINLDVDLRVDCYCEPPNITEALVNSTVNWTTLSKHGCKEAGGLLRGVGCNFVPDVFLFSVLLFIATFTFAVFLKDFKTTSYFPTSVRALVSDFSVVIAIGLMTLTDMLLGLETPKLEVPQKFEPTWEGRGWLIPWLGRNPWWTTLAAFPPALLATILIFMDQQITAVIINRKENKLKKGCGYHLDLLVLSVLIAICSVLGLPWFVAATVLAMTHVNSLRMESESSAPGEKPQFLGVREQRVTQILIFVLVGLSVFFTPVLKRIPMPVLYGVFLYMGVSSLKGSQFFDRILIMFMPQKYQPDYMFLRHVPTMRVHLFTLIQLTCLVCLWLIKSYKPSSIAFPLMLVVMIGVRKLLDFIFTQRELKVLDDVMPEHTKKKQEEEMMKEVEQEVFEMKNALLPDVSSSNVAIALVNGNLIKVPMEKYHEDKELPPINITEQLSQTGLWQSIDQQNQHKGSAGANASSATSAQSAGENGARKKKRGSKKDALNEEERKRLSTMAEEDDEEDCGITIRIDAPTPVPSKHASPQETKKPFPNGSETSV
ncbi:sodium-driven chloride bicarbonate exchanger isoform X3 [Ixodes scapularis]|uniref:sodium-driven chloride bicarbonate exchanger isoform X3 n=1 Tax=Ixodes scapularis TaxID=6945 RepID=UPI00116177E5|nr:sodium-driven chloride bicarbonate exchanger isoform X3 [Ixodes scapularis]